MITTVTLNAAIDRTYWVDGWSRGGVFRVKRMQNEPGGKGNNVAKVIRLLGGDVCASGFIAGANGNFIRLGLEERGIPSPFVDAAGESRVCLNIIDVTDGSSTELLETGPAIDAAAMERMKEQIRRLAATSSIVVLSGSLPAGLPADTYTTLISVIHAAGAKAFLDTSGAALVAGVDGTPDLIKPNETELMQLCGTEGTISEWDEDTLVRTLIDLAQKKGLPRICVTLGEKGALAYLEGSVYRAVPPVIEAVNTVGCGDAFVGGMAYAIRQGAKPEECLSIATAAAAANALDERAGYVDLETYLRLLEQVRVEKVR